MIKTIYTIPAPDAVGVIEVYGDPEYMWWEWRITAADGRIVRDTGQERPGGYQGHQYGQSEIALRDALMFASGLPIKIDILSD